MAQYDEPMEIEISDVERVRFERVREAQTRQWIALVLMGTLSIGTLLTVGAVGFFDADPTPMVAAMAPLSGLTGVVSNYLFRRST